jgi:AraC family transcriptional regulator
MYIQSVIETHEQSLQEFETLKKRGDGNTIINSHSKLCSWPTHTDRFSLKFAFNGTEHYCVNRNRITVNGPQFLVVNASQPYSSFIHSSDWVNSFSIYIGPVFFEQVVAVYTSPEEKLLDNPNHQKAQPVWFFEQVYTASPILGGQVQAFKTALEVDRVEPSEQEAYLHEIMALLLKTYQAAITQRTDSLACVKASTRWELYRRLHVAKEYIDDQVTETIDLDAVARTAMLSKNHLLRHFKALFGTSPYQYQIGRRMERAQESLLRSSLTIHQIAFEQGFECPSAFSRQFKTLFSVTPSQYRQQLLK